MGPSCGTRASEGGERPQDGDFLTVTLAAGEVVGDTSDDLVIGAPGENVDLFADEGAVAVLRGSSARLTATGNTLLTQSQTSDPAEAGDEFGFQLG